MMKNRNKIYTSIISLLTFFLMFVTLTSCNSTDKTVPKNTDNIVSKEKKELITISKDQFDLGAMKLGKISKQEFYTTVKANGVFAVPPEHLADISPYFSGYIKDISLLPGSAIKKGDVVFTIENPSYILVQQNFLEAKGKLIYLKSDYERQKELLADDITSKKKFLKAESDYEITLAQYQALKKTLHMMNINPNTLTGNNIQSVLCVTSSLSGYVTSVNVTKGMYINPSDVAVTITNTDQLHIELKIFEKDLLQVKSGQRINLKLQANKGKVYVGEVHLVNKSINPKDKTILVHADLVNSKDTQLFVPGMYVEAEILTSATKLSALPTQAIVNIDNDFFVLIKKDATHFKKIAIKTGMINNEFTQILNVADFNVNTEFLIQGAFELITE